MSEKMLVTQALDERDLLVKKIVSYRITCNNGNQRTLINS